MGTAEIDMTLRAIFADVTGMSAARAAEVRAVTPLFGALPEFDSMAVAGLLTEIEDRFGIVIDDEEVDGALLETYGSLLAFVASKRKE